MEKTEILTTQEVEVLYRTNYYGDGTVSWHEPFHKKGALKTMSSEVGPLKLQTAILEVDGKVYPVSHLRSGLDATVVTIHVRESEGWRSAFYTSILTEAGEKRGGPGAPSKQQWYWRR